MIDYPREKLDPHFWELDSSEEEYILLPEVKELVMSSVEEVCSYFKNCNPENILIGSSIGSQFYNEDADFDIKIVLNTHKLATDNNIQIPEGESLEGTLKDILDDIVVENDFKIANHPFEFFFLDTENFEDEQFLKRFDSLYDVNNDNWIRPVKMVDVETYNREEYLKEGLEKASSWAEKWDLQIGSIKRHVKDFKLLADYLKSLSPKHAKKMKAEVENILLKIEKEIDKLAKERKHIVKLRRESYANFIEEHENYMGFINSLPEIIQMKMLAYWGYLSIIKELKKILGDDDKISKHDILKIDNALD